MATAQRSRLGLLTMAALSVSFVEATTLPLVFGSSSPMPSAGAFLSQKPKTSLRLRGGGQQYSLGLRDSIMIAHSFTGEEFGPAQNMHGATYTVDVEFHVEDLVPRLNWVLDIGEGMTLLKRVLSQYNFKNLNELFPGENTTTEFMCKKIFEGLCKELKGNFKGSITVKLWESHSAWASYTNEISASGC
eukprot:768562-Hanusia_phi.AAC.6